MKSKKLHLLIATAIFLFSKNLTAAPASFLVDSLPRITCKDSLVFVLMPTGMISIWAKDFVENLEDDHFLPSDLEISIRKKCIGSSFPVNTAGQPVPFIIFTCFETGRQSVEIWVRNPAGKAAFCEADFDINDPFDNCGSSGGGLKICLETPASQPIRNATLRVRSGVWNPPPPTFFPVDSTGCRAVWQNFPNNTNSSIQPFKDDQPLNGVSTLDILAVKRHILGTQPFDSPWQLIAADVNRSGSVTTNDIVELRKLILGIYTDFPNNDSWRFVWRGHQFPNPANPFSTALPEEISVSQLQQSNCASGFVGVKIGDPSGNAMPAFSPNGDSDDRREPLTFFIENHKVASGEPLLLPVFLKEKTSLAGFQFEFENLETGQILGLAAGQIPISEEHFFMAGDGSRCSVSWTAGDGSEQVMLPDVPVFYLKIGGTTTADFSEKLASKNARLRSEIYAGGSARPLVFQFLENKSGSGSAAPEPIFYPNPTGGGQAWLLFENKNDSDLPLAWEVFDLAGRSVLRGSEVLPTGANRVALPLDFLPAGGVFYLKTLVGGQVFGRVFRA